MKFHIATFGCRTNQADSAAIRAGLLEDQHQEASFVEADLVVVNSCTVTHRTDQQVRQMARKIRSANPEARIIVTGCYAQRDPGALTRIEGIDAVAGNTRKGEILEIWHAARERCAGDQGKREAAVYRDEFAGLREMDLIPATHVGGKTRPFVKVQDGCDAGCAYCVIPEVRGPGRSVPAQQIIGHVRELVAHGFREIVLTGIHIGSYGLHDQPRCPLDRLLEKIIAVEGLGQVRLSSIEPMELSRRIIDLAAGHRVIAPHFHLCAQSGSDTVLKRMRRPYNSSRFAEIVTEIREKIPQAGIGTDLISGFPGETEREHRETVEFVRRMPFTYLHVFPYSDRPGTVASRMSGKVRPEIVKRRAKELRRLSVKKQEQFREQFLDTSISVLTLSSLSEGLREAVSGNYLAVWLNPSVPDNRLVQGRVARLEQDHLVLADEGLRIVR